ncbi:hypothetical protein J3A83DRAFT_4185150 [Scleroderma citrinum]
MNTLTARVATSLVIFNVFAWLGAQIVVELGVVTMQLRIVVLSSLWWGVLSSSASSRDYGGGWPVSSSSPLRSFWLPSVAVVMQSSLSLPCHWLHRIIVVVVMWIIFVVYQCGGTGCTAVVVVVSVTTVIICDETAWGCEEQGGCSRFLLVTAEALGALHSTIARCVLETRVAT